MNIFERPLRPATEANCKAAWGGGKPGERFRCYLCGHKFAVGDMFRLVYANDRPGTAGNFIVCDKCDGPDVVERWVAACKEAATRFWWARPGGG